MQRVKARRSAAGERDAGNDEGGRRILWLRARLDADTAAELLARLREVPERDIIVDVGLVREVDEVGVAALARLAGASGDPRIVLRGLSARQLRILRHLGAGLSQVAAANER
jgi:anti-anti-sigma regulatory factor